MIPHIIQSHFQTCPVLAVALFILTQDDEELPALDLGTGFAFGPAALSLVGFFMGVVWIDMLASEVWQEYSCSLPISCLRLILYSDPSIT